MAKADLFTGLKFRKLERLLPEVCRPHLLGHLELLWQTAWASHRISFDSAEDVELAAEWDGQPGKLADAFLSAGFLDKTDLGIEIHDWWDHFPEFVRKRKRSLLIALGRSYDGIRPQWLKDRGFDLENLPSPEEAMKLATTCGQLSGNQRPTTNRPAVNHRSANGPPCPTQSMPTNSRVNSQSDGNEPPSSPGQTRRAPPTPFSEIVDLWNQIVVEAIQKHRHVEPETAPGAEDQEARKRLRSYWHRCQAKDSNNPIQAHRDLCGECCRSSFLLGARSDFVVSLLWAVGPQNESKIRRGTYRDKPRRNETITGDPVLDDYKEQNL